MEFSRQEYWSGLPFPSPGDLPDPGIKPGSPALLADSLPSELQGSPVKIWWPLNLPITFYFPLMACEILGPQPGIETMPSAVTARSPNL